MISQVFNNKFTIIIPLTFISNKRKIKKKKTSYYYIKNFRMPAVGDNEK